MVCRQVEEKQKKKRTAQVAIPGGQREGWKCKSIFFRDKKSFRSAPNLCRSSALKGRGMNHVIKIVARIGKGKIVPKPLHLILNLNLCSIEWVKCEEDSK